VKAQALVEMSACTVQEACEVLGLARSSYDYDSQRAEAEQLLADLEQEARYFPKYGSRRLTHQLRRAPYHHRVNRKKIQRLMPKKGLLRPQKRVI
jgi:hypothetical protein